MVSSTHDEAKLTEFKKRSLEDRGKNKDKDTEKL